MGKKKKRALCGTLHSAECAFQHHRPRLLKLDEWLCKWAKGIFFKCGPTHTHTFVTGSNFLKNKKWASQLADGSWHTAKEWAASVFTIKLGRSAEWPQCVWGRRLAHSQEALLGCRPERQAACPMLTKPGIACCQPILCAPGGKNQLGRGHNRAL